MTPANKSSEPRAPTTPTMSGVLVIGFSRAGTKRKNDDQISSVERKIPNLPSRGPLQRRFLHQTAHHIFGCTMALLPCCLVPDLCRYVKDLHLIRSQTEIKNGADVVFIQQRLASGVNRIKQPTKQVLIHCPPIDLYDNFCQTLQRL